MTAAISTSDASAVAEGRLLRDAFLMLAGVMAAHALLETARDALFLANLPVEELPKVYLAIVGIALVTSKATAPLRAAYGNRRSLSVILGLGAIGTALANFLVFSANDTTAQTAWVYHGLYVWTAVISSLAVFHFWLTLADRLTITQGKRLYARIAMGGSIGALGGFGLAALLSFVAEPETLILVSAAIFGLCAIGSLFGLDDSSGALTNRGPGAKSKGPGFIAAVRKVGSERYSRGVAFLIVISTIAFTLADYLFKSYVASEVATEDLMGWLANAYLGLNLSSTLVLAFVATPILRRIGLQRSLAVLPIFFVLGGFGFVMGLGISAIAILKSSEGVLRHSLHRVGSELLFLPMSVDARNATKIFSEIVGDKGAKALASLGILAIVPLSQADNWIALILVGLSAAWIATAYFLRGPYLELFRQTLAGDSIKTRIELPDLDLESLETLIHALNHHDDRMVSAAMTLLQDRDRPELIPSLILYHPSESIVEQALEIFASAGRRDIKMHTERLLGHEDASIRAATTRAIAVIDPNREQLEELATVDCPCIRVSAVIGLLQHGWIDKRQARLEFDAILGDPRPDARRALARSATLYYSSLLRESVVALAQDDDPGVRSRAIEAIQKSGDAYYTRFLVDLLRDRTIREAVRDALLDRREAAILALAAALYNPQTPSRILIQIPTTLARFENLEAAKVLLGALDRRTSGVLRFKILSSMQRLMRSPEIRAAIDTAGLEIRLGETTGRAIDLLDWQVQLETCQIGYPDFKTMGGELLLDLLGDKERLAISRIFILLDLLHAKEDLGEIRSGISSREPRVQASSIELLENLLPPAQAKEILALVVPAPIALRQERLRSLPRRQPSVLDAAHGANLQALLASFAEDRSASLRALANYYESELGFETQPSLETDGRPSAPDDPQANALALLDGLVDQEATHG